MSIRTAENVIDCSFKFQQSLARSTAYEHLWSKSTVVKLSPCMLVENSKKERKEITIRSPSCCSDCNCFTLGETKYLDASQYWLFNSVSLFWPHSFKGIIYCAAYETQSRMEICVRVSVSSKWKEPRGKQSEHTKHLYCSSYRTVRLPKYNLGDLLCSVGSHWRRQWCKKKYFIMLKC